ncbi:MAG: agmatinase family protein [Polyangiales bacterium]
MSNAFDPNAAAPEDSGIFGLPHTPDESRVVLIPVPFDATTSYRAGTANGPRAILAASRQVDLFDIELGKIYEDGIAMLPEPEDLRLMNDRARVHAEKILAVGGDIAQHRTLAESLHAVNDASASMNAWVKRETTRWLDAGRTVGVIGGDHSVPLGSIRAHASKYPELGVLHFDAHADLRAGYEGFRYSHASIMHNVLHEVPNVARIVQVGVRDLCEEEYWAIQRSNGRVVPYYDANLKRAARLGETWHSIAERVVETLPHDVYVSFDIDGLDPTLCPHTGTPVPGGLSLDQALAVIEMVAGTGRRIVGVDMKEVAPNAHDPDDEWDGNVAARLLYKLIGWTLKSQGPLQQRSAHVRTDYDIKD